VSERQQPECYPAHKNFAPACRPHSRCPECGGCYDCTNQKDDLQRGIFLLDIEHDPAALQALEVYAYAVSKAGDRPLCDELIQKISEVRARRKA